MADLNGKKLGVLLAADPAQGDVPRVQALAGASLAAGVDTYLYLIDRGTIAYRDVDWQPLKEQGLKLFVCAYGAMQQGIQPDQGAVFGGLSVLGGIMEGCDQFVSFN